jgi:PAS domain S-box-containing protein
MSRNVARPVSSEHPVSTNAYSVPQVLIEQATEWFPDLGFAVVTTDLAGTITSWNPHATQLFGWTAEQTVGKPVSEFLISTVQQSQTQEIVDQLREGRPWAGRFVVRRHDGSYMTTEFIDLSTVNESGQRCGFVAIMREDASALARSFHDLARSRIVAQEFDEIRAEISREIAARLHDDLSQRSHLLLLRTKEILHAPEVPADLRSNLQKLHLEQEAFISALQSVWRSLRPPLLDEFGARAALEHLEFVAREGGIGDVSVGVDDEIDQLGAALKEIVVLIAQEAIANVISHSKATRCSLSVTVENSSVTIEVTDNGVGMSGEEGFGLSVMRDRVRHFGGYLEVVSGPNGGCTLFVQIEQSWTSLAPLETLIDPHIMLKAERDASGEIVDFVYTDANDAALTYNRTTREQLIGSRLVDLLPGHRGSGLLAMYVHTVETGEPLVLDNFIYPNEIVESDRHYDIRAIKVGDSLSYTWRDVTEREALIENYRLLAENASDIVSLTSPDGLIKWVSPSITRELGYHVADVVGHHENEYLHSEDLEVRDESLQIVNEDFQALFELRLRHSDGSYRWYEASLRNVEEEGVVVARINTLRAINDEVSARLALESAIENYRLLAENVSDVVYRTTAHGIIDWISPSVQRVLGWRDEDLIGTPGINLMASDDAEKMRFWRHHVSQGRSASRVEAKYRTAHGDLKWMSINARPLYNDQQEFIGAAITLRDMDREIAMRNTLGELTGQTHADGPGGTAKEFLDHLCDTILRQGDYLFSWYARRSDDVQDRFEKFAAAAINRGYMTNLDMFLSSELASDEPTGHALQSEQVVVLDDISNCVTNQSWKAQAVAHGLKSCVALPVSVSGRLHGVWTIYAGEAGAFNGPLVQELERVARSVGRQIERT